MNIFGVEFDKTNDPVNHPDIFVKNIAYHGQNITLYIGSTSPIKWSNRCYGCMRLEYKTLNTEGFSVIHNEYIDSHAFNDIEDVVLDLYDQYIEIDKKHDIINKKEFNELFEVMIDNINIKDILE